MWWHTFELVFCTPSVLNSLSWPNGAIFQIHPYQFSKIINLHEHMLSYWPVYKHKSITRTKFAQTQLGTIPGIGTIPCISTKTCINACIEIKPSSELSQKFSVKMKSLVNLQLPTQWTENSLSFWMNIIVGSLLLNYIFMTFLWCIVQ